MNDRISDRVADWNRDHPFAEGMPQDCPTGYRQSMSNDNRQRVWRCNDCHAIYPEHQPRCRFGRTYEAQVELEGAYYLRRDDTETVPYCGHCGGECVWDDDLFTHRDEQVARECWQRRFAATVEAGAAA